MFGLFNKQKIDFHEAKLNEEFGIKLKNIPEHHVVSDIFTKLTRSREFSKEAKTSIFFRIIALQYASITKILIIENPGEELREGTVNLILKLINRSVDWSEKAQDHIELETVTSNMNLSIEKALTELGIQNTRN